MSAEEQHDRLETVLAELGVPKFEERAAALYARGVRVLQLDEVIVSRSDAKLLDLVRQATEGWERAKQEAKERSREQLSPGVADAAREELILAALNGAGTTGRRWRTGSRGARPGGSC